MTTDKLTLAQADALRGALVLLQAANLSPHDLYAYATALDAVDYAAELNADSEFAAQGTPLTPAEALEQMKLETMEDGGAGDELDALYERATTIGQQMGVLAIPTLEAP